jgi:hypothetical protein
MTSLDRCLPSHNLLLRCALAELHAAHRTIDRLREQLQQERDERERYAREVFGPAGGK